MDESKDSFDDSGDYGDDRVTGDMNAGDDDFSDDDFGNGDSEGSYEDGDDSFNYSTGNAGGKGAEAKQDLNKTQQVPNQHYDETYDIEGDFSDESVDTNTDSTYKAPQSKVKGVAGGMGVSDSRGDSPPRTALETAPLEEDEDRYDRSDDDEGSASPDSASSPDRPPNRNPRLAKPDKIASVDTKARISMDDDHDGEDGSSTEGSRTPTAGGKGDSDGDVVGAYNPDDYANLNASSEVRELFQYIGRYKPHNQELDTRLKCFVPDYIPAVGEIDAFIKVPRPDETADELGLKVLDEPAANQSDPTLLDLQFRAMSKKSNLEPMLVRSIENAEKNPKAISNWIKSIKELHRSKPPPQVNYSKPMPDIEALMQVWPDEIEQLVNEIELPGAGIDLDIRDYVRVVCALTDIPVYNSMTESLHVLFTLYSEFRNNQHFVNMGGEAAGVGQNYGVPDSGGSGAPNYASTAGAPTSEGKEGY